MRLSTFRENDNVLLVGEGNFSFAASLVLLNLQITITASCYESSVINENTRKNLKILSTHGVRVLFGVDGTKLPEHPVLRVERFDKIIFNFPHVGGKMRIERNRELLKNFFSSAREVLKSDGAILLTLCNGQGGTLADNPRRRWDDSWKVTEMAAYGNFVLTSVESFQGSKFKEYTPTGYRGLDKEFNVLNSLTHFFSNASSHTDLSPKRKFDFSNLQKFSDGIKYRELFFFDPLNSLCPPIFVFDITFSVPEDFSYLNLYFILYNFAGRIIRDVEFVRSYEFSDLGKFTESYRISYQSDDIPLYRERIVDIHRNIIAKILEDNLNVIVTR